MFDAIPTCLIVEDSELDRRIMTRVLERQAVPPHVVFAYSLAEARRVLRDMDVSIVFLDNALPDGYGANFLNDLVDESVGRCPPVVIVSDWPSPFMFAKAEEGNVLAVWSKRDFTVERVKQIMARVKRAA